MNGHQRSPIVRLGAFLTPLAFATALACASAASLIQPMIHTFPAPGMHRPAVPPGTQFECYPPVKYDCIVQKTPSVVVDFWGDFTQGAGKKDQYQVMPYVTAYVENLGGTPYFALLGQYKVENPKALCPPPVKDVSCIWNHKVAPPAAPTAMQVAQEAEAAATHFGKDFGFVDCPKQCENLNTQTSSSCRRTG